MGINSVDRVLIKNNSFDPKWPETHFLSRSTWLDPYWPGGLGFDQKWWFWPEMAWNSFFIPVNMVWPILTGCTRFWPKMTVLARNGLKLIFYPGRHDLTHIDPVDSVLVENDGFDPKRHETHFLPWSTWFDPYWSGGLDFGWKWRFWPETSWNSFFTLVDMVWPVLTRWTRFWWKDVVDSRKIYFWILNFFLIFLDFYE